MRSDNLREKTPLQRSIGLSKTAATAMAILGLVSFGILIYCLFQAKPKEGDALAFFLPYVIPFGLASAAAMGLGIFCLGESDHRWARKTAGIAAISLGGTYAAASFLYAWPLGNVEMAISIAVIALCVLFLGWLSLSAIKEEGDEQ